MREASILRLLRSRLGTDPPPSDNDWAAKCHNGMQRQGGTKERNRQVVYSVCAVAPCLHAQKINTVMQGRMCESDGASAIASK
jgi:hypothetical protein